jgi:hypothetical protein
MRIGDVLPRMAGYVNGMGKIPAWSFQSAGWRATA